MISFLKFLNNLLDFAVLIFIIFYTVLFYLKNNLFLISNLFFIIIFFLLTFKLFYFIKNRDLIKKNSNNKKIEFYFIYFCLFIIIYITPIYYILSHTDLVTTNYIKIITLNIILILALISFIAEKFFFVIKFKMV